MKHRSMVTAGVGSLVVASLLFTSGWLRAVCVDFGEGGKPKITFSGFINPDIYWDTRQVNVVRPDEPIYPKKWDCTENGCDANAEGDFDITPFNVRVKVNIDDLPFFCGSKTSAYISGDFRGISANNIPQLRLRQAYLKMEWDGTALLFGQANHPVFQGDCFANTVSYNGGEPLVSYARAPQIRLTQQLGFEQEGKEHPDELVLALVAQLTNCMSPGPDGHSWKYLCNSKMPVMHIQWRHFFTDDCFFGIGGQIKRLVPQLKTLQNYKNNEGNVSGLLVAYARQTSSLCDITAMTTFAHDGSDLGYIDGYAVACRDETTGCQSYANLRSLSVWFDLDLFPESSISPGLFCGVAKNFGASERLYRDPDTDQLIIYTSMPDNDLSYVTRISPRVWYYCHNFWLGIEFEWTHAAFGTLNDYGRAECSQGVDNVRCLAGVYYYF